MPTEKITLYTKNEVIQMIAIFNNISIDNASKLIDFENVPGNDYVPAFDVYVEDSQPLAYGRYSMLLVPANDYKEED